MIPDQVKQVLLANNLEAVEFEEGSTPTVQTAAAKLGVAAGQIAKSLLFSGKDREYAMVVCAGDAKVSLSKLKRAAGFKPKLASPEETLTVTGYKVGGVCPFVLPPSLTVLIDESVFQYATVYPAAGNDSSGVPVAPAELQRITRAVRVDVAAGPASA